MEDLELLLNNGADVNTKDVNGFSLLMSCSKKNDLVSIRSLLNHSVSMNAKDKHNFTALDYAIKNGKIEAIKLLVQNGANISSDSYMFALKTNHKEIIKYFDSLDPNKYIFLKNRK